MRTILIGIYLILYTIVSLPMFLIFFIVGKFSPDKKARASQVFVMNFGFKPILFLAGVKATVKGRENIQHGKGAMYAYNHRGFFDVLVGYTTAPYPTAFVSKKEIEKVPMLARWMKYMNCLFLDRSDPRQGLQTILKGIELLKAGTSIYIAPEGTRSKTEEILEFHEGSFKLADKSKCPIVPVAINNTDAVFEKHLPWIHRAHVIIEYCEPVYMTEMDREDKKHVGKIVREIIAEKVKENAKEI